MSLADMVCYASCDLEFFLSNLSMAYCRQAADSGRREDLSWCGSMVSAPFNLQAIVPKGRRI